ncbi:MAG: hypothetical protein HY841_11150 [Bacteroidetes bacterium]|nr:hypothetical protein [Bacteroidota bacterium]
MRKSLLLVTFIFICFFSFAQTADTAKFSEQEMKKQILSLQKDISTINLVIVSNAKSGIYLKKASNNYFIGLACNIVGAAMMAGGVAYNNSRTTYTSLNGTTHSDDTGMGAPLIFFGGGVTLTGLICEITAWANIHKAGKIIQHPNR